MKKMKFDPTNDYYGLDLSKETNRVNFNFWELIKVLVTLSSSANRQKEIIGFGEVADEMAIDFESYYTLNFQSYLDNGLLTEAQVAKLNLLDKFLEDRSGENMIEFWNDDFLDSHPDWEKVRIMAKEILKEMNYDNLEIGIERTTRHSKSGMNRPLIEESTKVRLKTKNTQQQRNNSK